MGQLVLGVAGAVAGSFIPGVGTAIGFAVGSAIGAMMFPPKMATIKGQTQSLMDLKVTGSEYGQAIPYARGTVGIAGQVWWNSDRRPVTTTSGSPPSGGKGGGGGGGGGGESPAVETSTTTYNMDMLIGLTDNPISGISRVWSNGRLLYTAEAGASVTSVNASAANGVWSRLTVYTGSDTQLPDPTYEAAVGVANAPAYRGRGTVFIQELQLGESGQVPNLVFEVVVDGSVAQETLVMLHFNGELIQSYDVDGNPAGNVVTNSTVTTDDFGNAVTLVDAALSSVQAKFGSTSLDCRAAGALCTVAEAVDLNSDWTMEMWYYAVNYDPPQRPPGGRTYFGAVNAAGYGLVMHDLTQYGPYQQLYTKISENGISVTRENIGSANFETRDAWNHIALCRDGSTGYYYGYINGVSFYNNFGIATICPVTKIVIGGDPLGVRDSLGGWADEFKFSNVCKYPGVGANGTNFTPPAAPFNPFLLPVVTSVPPTVAAVVSDLCLRAELAAGQFDVTGLSTITRKVRAMPISQIAPTRAALELLMSTYFFEMVESDKIYFRPRGGASLATIPYLDLGAVVGDGEPSEPLALRQVNELEIPAQIALSYSNVNNDYQIDTQYSDRLISASAGTVASVQMAIGMIPSEAKAVADTMLLDQAASVISTKIAVLSDYCRLEPTDPVTVVAADGSTLRMRLVKKMDMGPMLEFDAVMDDVSVLTSQGIASADYTSSTIVAPVVDSLMEILDIPILQDADNDPGFYVAAKGDGTPWPGTAVFNSSDNITYIRRATVLESAVFGECSTTLGDWTGPRIFDEMNTVTVDVGAGTLDSTTRDAVLNNASVNAMLIGSEVLQFRTATLIGIGIYTLSGLLRGGRGTEWAMIGHVAAERCVLLRSAGMRRIVLPNNELGLVRYYKDVTLGQALSAAAPETFIDTAIGLKPFSPFDLRIARDSSNNITGTFQRRSRLTVRTIGTLGISVPLGESTEAYQIEIYSSAAYATVVRTISAAVASFSYTAAQQTADGLAPGALIYARVYQMSQTVGRGYKLEMAA